jgi:DNA-binding MarR family transcriptional regulator
MYKPTERLGPVQKAVLKALKKCPDNGYREMVVIVFGADYTRADQANLARAIRGLRDRGLVEIYSDPVGRYVGGVRVTTPGMAVCLPGRRIFEAVA